MSDHSQLFKFTTYTGEEIEVPGTVTRSKFIVLDEVPLFLTAKFFMPADITQAAVRSLRANIEYTFPSLRVTQVKVVYSSARYAISRKVTVFLKETGKPKNQNREFILNLKRRG